MTDGQSIDVFIQKGEKSHQWRLKFFVTQSKNAEECLEQEKRSHLYVLMCNKASLRSPVN